MMTKQTFHSDLAIPPGEFLEEVIADLGMSKDDLARRMNRPAAKLSAIFRGDKTITPDTALQLEKVVGVPAHIWTGLESEYRLTLARNQQVVEEERLKKEQHFVTKFCYKDLAKLGYVSLETKATEKVKELQRFFGVTSLETVVGLNRYQPAFRIWEKKRDNRSWESTATWLRIGEIEAQQKFCEPFNKARLVKALDIIRSMTVESPQSFHEKLESVLADAGVAFVVLQHLPKTYAHGATFWQGKHKAVILLTIRGSWADMFWFSLFHEIAHILLHGKQEIFLENDDMMDFDKEEEADLFASKTLIPEKEYSNFKLVGSFYKDDILSFADFTGIHPGIVVGRLQHDELIEPNWHNGLRKRFVWKED
jgi:HTH-type transcriptional regulator/antitoxin HigA